MTPLDVVDWRRTVFALYAAVRDEDDPAAAHRLGLRFAGTDLRTAGTPDTAIPAPMTGGGR